MRVLDDIAQNADDESKKFADKQKAKAAEKQEEADEDSDS